MGGIKSAKQMNIRYQFNKIERSSLNDASVFEGWDFEDIVDYKIYVFNRLVKLGTKENRRVNNDVDLSRYALITKFPNGKIDEATKRVLLLIQDGDYIINTRIVEDYKKHTIYEAKYVKTY
jgi:hypothetical protein